MQVQLAMIRINIIGEGKHQERVSTVASANIIEYFEWRPLSVTAVLEKTGSRGVSGNRFWIH